MWSVALFGLVGLVGFSGLAGPAAKRPPGPAETLAVSETIRAPMVLLSSDGSHTGMVDGVEVMPGMQLSDTQVAISTRGLSLALSVTSSDVTAPTRLARKVTSSALQQRWTVFHADGETRTGRLKFVSEDVPLAIVELTEPMEVTRTCEGPAGAFPTEGVAVGLDKFDGAYAVVEVPVQLVDVDGRYALISTSLPARFEGAMIKSREGACLGFATEVAGAGTPRVVTPALVQRAADRIERARDRVEINWAVGVGFGRVMDHDLVFESPVYGRLDLFIDRRWDLALEGAWQTFYDGSLTSDPTYLEVRNRRRRLPMSATVGYLFGPRASLMRAAVVAGGGVDIEFLKRRETRLLVSPDCVAGTACDVEVIDTSRRSQIYRPLLMVGLDVAALGRGPLQSLAGVRLGYRAALTVTDIARSLHFVLVTVSF